MRDYVKTSPSDFPLPGGFWKKGGDLRVALVCPVYPPEVVPAATMLEQLANHFAQSGHDVTVFTAFPSLPHGKVFEGYNRKLWRTTQKAPVRVIRCFSFVAGRKRRPFWRLLSHLSFAITASLRLLCDAQYDLIVMELFPIVSAPIVLATARLKAKHVVNYIQDLYPEAAEAAGVVRTGGFVSRAARAVDRFVCLKSDMNIVIAQSFRDALVLDRDVPEKMTEVVQNWIDGAVMKSRGFDNNWRAENGIASELFVAMFAGTLGLASGVQILVGVAEELRRRGRDDIVIVCIGEGLQKESMIRQANEKRLENLLFLPFQPAERVADMHSAADVMLLTIDRRHESSSVPSKLISYMAAGRAVLCCASDNSTLAETIRTAGCGKVIPGSDVHRIVDQLIEMAGDKAALTGMGANGRDFFSENFDVKVAMSGFDRIFMRFAGSN